VHVSKILGAAAKVMRGGALIATVAAAMIAFFAVLGGKLTAAAVIMAAGAVCWGVLRGLAHGLQRQADRLRLEPDTQPPAPRDLPRPRVRWDALRRWQAAARRGS
jgi:hypothetical protein